MASRDKKIRSMSLDHDEVPRPEYAGALASLLTTDTSKRELRATLRKLRRKVGTLDGSPVAAEVWDRYGGPGDVVAFEALPGEIDLSAFIRDAGARVWLPVVSSANGRPLSKLPVGFVSEDAAEPTLDIEAALIFVPALAVDASGVRLGQGGGWYDRALPALLNGCNNAKIFACVASKFFLPEDSLPVEPHDVRVDGVLTEAGWTLLD